MLSFKHIFLFFILYSSFHLHSSPTDACDLTKLKNNLIAFGLPPELTKNAQLLEEIKNKYGNSIESYLTEKHPAIKNAPDQPIDLNTLDWLRDAIWSTENIRVRYSPMFFIDNDNVMDEMIILAFERLYYVSQRTAFVFESEADFILFQKASINRLRDLILNKIPSFDLQQLSEVIKSYQKYYMTHGNYKIGFNSIAHTDYVVVLEGHGSAGFDGIDIGNATLSSEKIIKKLKQFNLAANATIKIRSCFSACEKNELNLTVDEIKKEFLSGKLLSHIKLGSGSFLEIFIRQLKHEFPEFNGTVEGYIGLVPTTPKNNVLKKNGEMMHYGNAVQVEGSDGSIYLKKEDAKVSISIL